MIYQKVFYLSQIQHSLIYNKKITLYHCHHQILNLYLSRLMRVHSHAFQILGLDPKEHSLLY